MVREHPRCSEPRAELAPPWHLDRPHTESTLRCPRLWPLPLNWGWVMVIFTSPSHTVSDFRKCILNCEMVVFMWVFFFSSNVTILKMYLIPAVALESVGDSTLARKPDFLQRPPLTQTPERWPGGRTGFPSECSVAEDANPSPASELACSTASGLKAWSQSGPRPRCGVLAEARELSQTLLLSP